MGRGHREISFSPDWFVIDEGVPLWDPRPRTDSQNEAAERVQAAVAQLSPKHQEVLYEHFYDQLDYSAMARLRGSNPSSTRRMTKRALVKLRALLENEED